MGGPCVTLLLSQKKKKKKVRPCSGRPTIPEKKHLTDISNFYFFKTDRKLAVIFIALLSTFQKLCLDIINF